MECVSVRGGLRSNRNCTVLDKQCGGRVVDFWRAGKIFFASWRIGCGDIDIGDRPVKAATRRSVCLCPHTLPDCLQYNYDGFNHRAGIWDKSIVIVLKTIRMDLSQIPARWLNPS